MSGADPARTEILRRVRDALGADPEVPPIPRNYDRTGRLDRTATVALFAERVGDYNAQVHRTTPTGLAGTLATIVASVDARRIGVPNGLPAGWLSELPERSSVTRDHGLSPAQLDNLDLVATGATVGIAMTGTIILDAGPARGRRALTLVPDHHVCVIQHDAIVHTLPQGLAAVEATRPLTMISGPSATSDIELDRVEGVHGPRKLDVIIVDQQR